MATSGITIEELTRDELIEAALRKIGVLGEGTSANATQLSDGAQALNAVVLEFMTLGMPLWKRTELAITMVTGQSTYTIGVGQTLNHPFPTKLYQANLAIPNSSARINMQILGHYDYNNLPVNATGTPVNVSYQPFINFGTLYVWPTPDASVPAGTQVYLTYQEPVEVFTAGGQTADFPQEWQNALIYTLALVLADEYGLPVQDKQWLEKQADKHLNTALSFGTEDASLFIQPDWQTMSK